MTESRQIEDAIFVSALDLVEPGARREFLDRACAGDTSLRAAVDAMLADHANAEKFFAKSEATFQTLAGELPSDMPAETFIRETDLPDQVGKWVGPYKIVERIGEGGCGAVYMAEQEKPIRRVVAVKIIKLGMDTRSVIARFEAERQALALMDHPNIAHVLDAGATEAGRPYFVMELVRGVKITDYCDQNNLDTRHRLELFITVCHAVQHAHQKGIIHRDIKPSNVLVTTHDGAATPKVIDFGIAKAIEGPLTDQTQITACEQIIGTPAYMSPEQADMSALDVDTRSDIYSLGVLLYELLTGRTPFDPQQLVKSGIEEMRRTLREKEPLRPSNILAGLHETELTASAAHRDSEPSKLISLLKGDLDWIVMKALEKDRARRYETANGLAVDVQRFLNNEPVAARPPSRIYRLQKLVRRNRATFAAIAAVSVALIAGLSTSTWLFLREREARRQQALLLAEAEKNEKITRAVFLVREEKLKDANALLEEIKTPPARPSFDAVLAFRTIGNWLALQQRWQEAAARYAVAVHLDQLDIWDPVTLDYQAYGVLLVENGDMAGYARFCTESISRYAKEPNTDAATRILKTCLLQPADGKLLEAMRPLGEKSVQWARAKPNNIWAVIPMCLWQYRTGNYIAATTCADKADKKNAFSSTATLNLIESMALMHEGRRAEALPLIERSRVIVNEGFRTGFSHGSDATGYWYDWLFARALLREADALVEAQEIK